MRSARRVAGDDEQDLGDHRRRGSAAGGRLVAAACIARPASTSTAVATPTRPPARSRPRPACTSTFPLEEGNVQVFLRPDLGVDGSLWLRSPGGPFGSDGCYVVVADGGRQRAAKRPRYGRSSTSISTTKGCCGPTTCSGSGRPSSSGCTTSWSAGPRRIRLPVQTSIRQGHSVFPLREPGSVLVLEEQWRGRLWSAIPHRYVGGDATTVISHVGVRHDRGVRQQRRSAGGERSDDG